jgi:hypothetical protein
MHSARAALRHLRPVWLYHVFPHSARYITNVHGSLCSVHYSGQILMKFQLYRQKYSDIKFNVNPFSGNRFVPFGRTDILSDMTKLIVAFRKHAFRPHSAFICYVWFSEQTAVISLHSMNILAFIKETVYCAV